MSKRRKKRSRIEDIRIMGRLLPAAEAAALADGEPAAGAEYLVLAALDLEDGSARRAFVRAGLDPDAFRLSLRAQHHDALRAAGFDPGDDETLDAHLPLPPVPPRGPTKTGPSAHRLFRKVVKLVRTEHSQLYGAYIVLVAARTERGSAARALRHMGADPERLARAAREELALLNDTSIVP